MTAADFVDAIQGSLSPQMTSRGFGPGGPGRSRNGSASFLFCIGAQEFATRFPSALDLLRTRTDAKLDEPSSCLDFVVEVSSSGEIERVDFEFVALDSLLRAADLVDLARRCDIEVLRKGGPDESIATIAEAVTALMPVEAEQ